MNGNSLNHYLQAWNLSDPQPLTETATSALYIVRHEGETVVLKLLTEYGWEEQRGGAALGCFGGHGAVRLYRMDEKAQLLEYADGAELVTLVENGDDAGATRIIADVLNQLHSGQSMPCEGVYPLDRWFEALFSKAEADAGSGDDSIFMRGAQVARKLLADPRDVRVLHGDIHHRNIRQSARGWLAFDAKGLIGERTYDCCNTLCNPYLGHPVHDDLVHNEQRLLSNAGILADTLGIDLPRLLAFAFTYACLSASWSLSINDGEVAAWMLGIARIAESHVKLG
ncbi:MAG: aminoglycoside phosphotransferase family protein [Chloroflexota bacterium]